MSQGTTLTPKRLKRRLPKAIIASLIILILMGAGYGIYYYQFRTVSTAIKNVFASVTRGSFKISITGSGPITSSNKTDISPKVGGTITKVNYKQGDVVKAGSIMFEMDDNDAITNLQKVYNTIAQTELQYKSTTTSISKLNVRSPFDGQVTDIQAKVGDTLSKGATIFTLTDLSQFKTLIPFNANNLNLIKPEQKVTVYVPDLMQSVTGIVSYVNDKPFSSANGGQIFNVEIIVQNPGALTKGLKVSAEINTPNGVQNSADYGVLDYINYSSIKADSGGTITELNVNESQFVQKDSLLVAFQNDDLTLTRETTESKLQDLSTQVDAAKKTVDNYKVYAPIDGTITKQDVNVGDVYKSGDVISSLSNNSRMEFSVAIDELDISKVQVGQVAAVTIDALPETTTRPLNAVVTKIATDGTSSNGVSTYPVTISLDGSDKLKGGMNANAEIILDQKTNVLRLPIQAVQKNRGRSYVYVKSATSDTTGNAKANVTPNPNNNSTAQQGNGNNNWQSRGQQGTQGIGEQDSVQQAGAQQGTGQQGTGRQRRSQNPNAQDTTGQGSGQDITGQGTSQTAGGSQNGSQQSGVAQGNATQAAGAQAGGTRGGDTQGGTTQGTAAQGNSGRGNSQGNNASQVEQALQNRFANNPELAAYYVGATMKYVEVGLNNEEFIEIISGLNEGEQVLLPPVFKSTTNAAPQQQQGGMPGLGGMGGMGGMGGGGNRGGGGGTQQGGGGGTQQGGGGNNH